MRGSKVAKKFKDKGEMIHLWIWYPYIDAHAAKTPHLESTDSQINPLTQPHASPLAIPVPKHYYAHVVSSDHFPKYLSVLESLSPTQFKQENSNKGEKSRETEQNLEQRGQILGSGVSYPSMTFVSYLPQSADRQMPIIETARKDLARNNYVLTGSCRCNMLKGVW